MKFSHSITLLLIYLHTFIFTSAILRRKQANHQKGRKQLAKNISKFPINKNFTKSFRSKLSKRDIRLNNVKPLAEKRRPGLVRNNQH